MFPQEFVGDPRAGLMDVEWLAHRDVGGPDERLQRLAGSRALGYLADELRDGEPEPRGVLLQADRDIVWEFQGRRHVASVPS